MHRANAAALPSRPADIELDQAARILLANMQLLTFMHMAPAPSTDEAAALAPSEILAVTQLYVTFWLGSTHKSLKPGSKQANRAVLTAQHQ
ncbi:hypothetical protein RRF57_002092 [Xylaria bambusicola]|uniref:Uncharacterized protein n=1 Tax=Xylaria bambusicola TaxID=326684 RepID=A0AAN7Z254_9PEZI